MGKLSAFRRLMYALSRFPGLGFLREASSAAYEAERTGRNINEAKEAAKELKGEDKKEEVKEIKILF